MNPSRVPPCYEHGVPSRIVLLGSGQSGSTLLGMGLALSPEVTSLGEISELGRVNSAQHECTCQNLFGRCPVWGPLFKDGTSQRAYDAGTLRRVLEHAESVEKTPWFVDSCKGDGALLAEREIGWKDARLLLLVRHPCGYVYSQLHNGYELDYALDAWLDEQERLLAGLDAWGEPWQLVQYEVLARDPSAELGRIGRWLGIKGPFGEREGPWDFDRAPWGPRQHVLSGASWRLDGRPRAVREDRRWHHALHPRAQRRIVDASRPLLERLGYHPPPDHAPP